MLNLEGLNEVDLVEGDDQYEIWAVVDPSHPAVFCDCEKVNHRRFGTKTTVYMDTPMHGKRVGIHVRRQRFQCVVCGEVEAEEVKVVIMDMWEPYRSAVKVCFPNARIVVDRFHVVMYANKAIETVRKEVRLGLIKKHRVSLLGDRWLMLTNEENLSAFKRIKLMAVLEQYPSIKEAYLLKESFREVWTAKDRLEAEVRLCEWETAARKAECMAAFKPLLSVLKNWREEIFGYMDWKLTNAYTESFNALARRMDNVGRGYSFEALKKRLMMTQGATTKRGDQPKFTRTKKREINLA